MAEETNEAAETATEATEATESSESTARESSTDDIPAMKRALAKANKEAKDYRLKTNELEARLSEFQEASMSEQERAIEQARQEAAEAARNEVLNEVRGKRLETEIRAAATGKLADPEDAIAFLATEDLDPDDPAAIGEAIAELMERKPHLKAGTTQAPGDIDQGPRGDGGEAQLTREDLALMSADEIVQAKAAGRLDHLLGKV